MSAWRARLWARVAALDYGVLLPALARLPRGVARPLWILRGLVNAVFDWDWRTLSLGHGYVRRSTMMAMRALRALSPRPLPPAATLTLRRYLCNSREEADCWRLLHLDYGRLSHEIRGLEALRQARREGLGVVLLTGHYDSLYVGLALLARAGLTVNLMSSAITQQQAVPPAIRRHFQRKISSLETLLAPGRVVHFEDDLGFFFQALRRGEIVVIACDGPSTTPKRATEVDFLGARRPMAPGLRVLAERTGAKVAMYRCQESRFGHFEVEVTEPLTLAQGGLQHAFEAFESHLLAQPWRWWAADLYPTYSVLAAPPAPQEGP